MVFIFSIFNLNFLVETLVDIDAQSKVRDLMKHQINDENYEYGIVSSNRIFWIGVHFFVDIFIPLISFAASGLNTLSECRRNTFTHTIVKPNAVVVKMRGASVALSAMF